MSLKTATGHALISDDDVYLFNEGNHYKLYRHLGAHVGKSEGVQGTHFAVWAPNVEHASIIGDFNSWDPRANPLKARGSSGIWEGFVEGVGQGELYKYHLAAPSKGYHQDKADPVGFWHQTAPQTASVIWDLRYQWTDREWMKQRKRDHQAPMSIYELHVGSWKRIPEEHNRPLGYRELAHELVPYLKELGFTHVELLPITEHPFYGSWGYQATGYFAPTSRYGTPQDLKYMIDHLHKHGIGVILDWVPSHFPEDAFGLARFDGTALFEHEDPRKGFHPDWKSCIFNYDRHEVRSFLISSAMYWLEEYHIDGLRVDAVASMLYLDYSRGEGEWIPNEYGGRENLGAIQFLRQLNDAVHVHCPGAITIAEESTSWPGVTKPTHEGGLGFDFKWDMGWMNDTLEYFAIDPIYRKYHHDKLTFRSVYANSERYILSISHDEVVHGKGSLINKMAGDRWQKFGNLRLLMGYMHALPGKKLLFMGQEFAQGREWAHERSLDWHLLKELDHAGLRRWISDLNAAHHDEPALHQGDQDESGFEWIDGTDQDRSVITFLRWDADHQDVILVALNFTPVPRGEYRLGVPRAGRWVEILNSDAHTYGGAGFGNMGQVFSQEIKAHGRDQSVSVMIPPLGAVFLKWSD